MNSTFTNEEICKLDGVFSQCNTAIKYLREQKITWYARI